MTPTVKRRLSAATQPATTPRPVPNFREGQRVHVGRDHFLAYPIFTRGTAGYIAGPPRRVRLTVLWPVRFGVGPSFLWVRAGHLRTERQAAA